jgi:hypothetical protein
MTTQSRTSRAGDNEVTILARFLTKGDRQLPKTLARYILGLTISEQDKARMHDLAVRNQDDALTPAEKEEMHAFGKAGDYALGLIRTNLLVDTATSDLIE